MGSEAALASSPGNSAPGAQGQEHPAWIRDPASPPGLPRSLGGPRGPLALPPGREPLCRAGAGQGAGHPSPQCTALSAASRPPPSHVQMRSGRPCPDVPLPLCCPDAHSAARRPDVRALVLAAPNEVQMFGLAWAGGGGGYQRRGRPWEGGAGLQLDAPAPSRARTLEAGKRWARLAQARAASRPGLCAIAPGRRAGAPPLCSGCEGKLGVALESLQGLRDLT